MKSVYFAFIRHGHYHQPKDVPSALLPHPLTEAGRQQSIEGAQAIIQFLNDKRLKVNSTLYTSTLLRAYETGQIFQEQLAEHGSAVTIQSSDDLCERSVGAMANLTVEQIEAIIDKDPRFENPPTGWKSSTSYRLPYVGAESLDMAGKRVYQFINNVLSHSLTGTLTLFIGHGASIRHAARHFGHWDEATIAQHSMYYARPVIFKYSPTEQSIELVAGNWKVRAKKEELND